MKITQVMLSKGFGGAERYFIDLSRALIEHGHNVQVICHKNFRQLPRLRSIPGLHVDTVYPFGWWDFFVRRRIFSAIARHRPVVVQAHLARGAYIAGRVCAELKIPLVVKTHNYVNLKYYSQVDCFITTTIDQRSYLLNRGIDEGRIRVIPNFSYMRPVQTVSRTGHTELIISSYGRLVRKKGFHVLLRAFKIVIDSGKKARLHIGGDGLERSSLISLCAQLGLDQHVRFCGWIEDVGDFLETADICVLPSLDEPFGIAVLEMMAMGKPIVATSTQGPMEILDNNTAWLVAPGDVDALASALIDAAGHESERLSKAGLALQVFREKYSGAVVVPQILSLYQSLTRSRTE